MSKRVLKADLADRVRELERKLAETEAELKTLRNGSHIDCNGRRYVPAALTREQAESVRETVEDCVYRSFGDGDWIEGSYRAGGVYEHWFLEDGILPGFAGFLARGPHDYETGWHSESIWGLIRVPRPCGMCRKPSMRSYNCETCMAEYSVE